MKIADLKVGMIVEEQVCAGPIGSGKVTPMCWQRARVTAIVKRKSKSYPHGHVKVDVLRDGGDVEVHDEIPIEEIARYLRLPSKKHHMMPRCAGVDRMKRVDIKAILANPAQRRELMVSTIIATQAREGIVTTRAQAEAAYDAIQTEKGR